MSRFNKLAKTPYLAATTGAALLALASTAVFDSTGAANGQTPETPALQPAANAPTTGDASDDATSAEIDAQAPSAAPANPNPNPLGIGTDLDANASALPTTLPAIGLSTPPANPIPTNLSGVDAFDPTRVPGANAPIQYGGAAGTGANDAELANLRSRVRALQAQLQTVPRTAAEQQAQQKIVAELSDLQTQIQTLETAAGQFSAFRKARDAQAAQNALGFGADGYDGIGRDPQAALDASGLNSAAPSARLGRGALDAGEAGFLQRQQADLTKQYRQLQQMLRSLQPGDKALAENLKQEQATVLAQLKDVEARLAAVPAETKKGILSTQEPTDPFAALEAATPAANRLPKLDATGTLNDVSGRMQKAQDAVALLREAGLDGLANRAASEIPRMANPDFVETQLVPGTWAEGSGLAEERSNPFQQISAEDVQTIRTSIDDLKTRVDALAETLGNVETQLKLLTRRTVDAPAPVVAPNPTPAPATPEANRPTDAAPVDATPAE